MHSSAVDDGRQALGWFPVLNFLRGGGLGEEAPRLLPAQQRPPMPWHCHWDPAQVSLVPIQYLTYSLHLGCNGAQHGELWAAERAREKTTQDAKPKGL